MCVRGALERKKAWRAKVIREGLLEEVRLRGPGEQRAEGRFWAGGWQGKACWWTWALELISVGFIFPASLHIVLLAPQAPLGVMPLPRSAHMGLVGSNLCPDPKVGI